MEAGAAVGVQLSKSGAGLRDLWKPAETGSRYVISPGLSKLLPGYPPDR